MTPDDQFVKDLKAAARQYVDDNFAFPDERIYLLFENAMLLGAVRAVAYAGEVR